MNEYIVENHRELAVPSEAEIEQKYFKPQSADWKRLLVDTPPPSQERQTLIKKVVREGLQKIVAQEQGNSAELNVYLENNRLMIYLMSLRLIAELAEYVVSQGVRPDEIDFNSGFEEESMGFEVEALDQEHEPLRKEAIEYLKNVGYRNTLVYGSFSRLNLAILAELNQLFPGLCISAQTQYGGFIEPVQGVIFKSLSLGAVEQRAENSSSKESGWDSHWGETYIENWKRIFREWLKNEAMNLPLDSTVLDLGSGMKPVTTELPHQLVFVDSAAHNEKSVANLQATNRQGLLWDINTDRLSSQFHDALTSAGVKKEKIRLVVMSDLLNYIDHPDQLVAQIHELLATDGKLVISNMPDQGYPPLFSKDRPENNVQLVKLLTSAGFRLETITSANNIALQQREKVGRFENVVVVARK